MGNTVGIAGLKNRSRRRAIRDSLAINSKNFEEKSVVSSSQISGTIKKMPAVDMKNGRDHRQIAATESEIEEISHASCYSVISEIEAEGEDGKPIFGTRLSSEVTVQLPGGTRRLAIGMRSRPGQNRRGHRKKNQDSILIQNIPSKGIVKGQFAVGVFDGHGPFGAEVSSFVSKRFSNFDVSESLGVQDQWEKLFEDVWTDLSSQESINIHRSGSTANVCVFEDSNTLHCFNVGDCRAVLGSLIQNTRWTVKDLSSDHSPARPDERERVEASGGKVGRIGEVLRIFLKDTWEKPGLTMTRSFGDGLARTIGVHSVPEVFQPTNFSSSKQHILIVASDGIWEHSSSQDAVQMAARFWQRGAGGGGAQAAAEGLVEEARMHWEENEATVDDCTCIVCFIDREDC